MNLPRFKPRDGWHYGDPDYYGELLWVPFECKTESHSEAAHLVAFTPDLTSVVRDVTLGDYDAAWVAWNAMDGTVYMSSFDPVSEVRQYAFLTNPVQRLVLLRSIPLVTSTGASHPLRRVQGGAFSPNGHLYLSSDDKDDPSLSGVYGVDVESGTIHMHVAFEYHPGSIGDEIEGIDVNPSWPMYPGTQIHLSMVNYEVGANDTIYLKHFAISDTTKL